MKYFMLNHVYPKAPHFMGSVEYDPTLEEHYDQTIVLPSSTEVRIKLHSNIKKCDVDYLHLMNEILVSDEFKFVLENMNPNLNFFNADISYHNGKNVDKKYWLVHNINKIDAIDYEFSNIDFRIIDVKHTIPPSTYHLAKRIRKLMISKDKAQGNEFFFLDHISEPNVFIAENCYKKLIKLKLKLNLLSVDDYFYPKLY